MISSLLVLKWILLQLERAQAMRLGLLSSAARITLSFAILSAVLAGEPAPQVRRAMAAEQWPSARPTPVVRIISTSTPTGAPTPTTTPTAVRTATPAPTSSRLPASSPPTWIEAPSIHLSAPVVETGLKANASGGADIGEWEVPDAAAGFHRGSALPGHVGNTVISGHNNMGSEVFRYLEDLKVGDEVILYVGDTPYRYRVAEKELVREQGESDEMRRQNARWIAPTDDERLTLVTCWPYTGNSHRLVIVARPEG